jgi:hypothetical protein
MVSAQTAIARRVATGAVTPGRRDHTPNVGEAERWVSAAGGGLLALYGLSRGALLAWASPPRARRSCTGD